MAASNDGNRMIDQPEDYAQRIASPTEPRKEVASTRGGCLVSGLALLLFCLSLVWSTGCESWNDVRFLCYFNFLVIAPLWASTAVLHSKGTLRIVLAIVAFILPATILSMLPAPLFVARTTPPRRSITRIRMIHTFERIQAYTKEHRQIPPSLTVLPAAEGQYDNSNCKRHYRACPGRAMIGQLERRLTTPLAVSADRRVVPAARRGGHHATVAGNCQVRGGYARFS